MSQDRRSRRRDHDYLILGAGPAGLQLGYFLDRAGRDYRILEAADEVGSFFDRYPRMRELVSFNKVYSIYKDPEMVLRWDWNSLLTEDYGAPFADYSRRYFPTAGEMVRYLRDYARRYRLAIDFGVRAERVSRQPDGRFAVRDQQGRVHRGRRLIVATGMGTPYVPDIPGIELAEGYETVSTDPEDFVDQRVLVLGKGNSGFEIANNLLPTAALIHIASPRPLRLAWNSRHPGHVRGQQALFLDSYQLKTLHSALDCSVEGIERDDRGYRVAVSYTHAEGEREVLEYDRVIRCTGFRFDGSIFDPGCRPLTVFDGRLPEMAEDWQSPSVEGLYFAGTLMQARDFQVAGSAFIDGFRYNVRTLHHMLEHRYHDRPLPGDRLPATAEAVAERVIERINWTSSLWNQFSVLCDAVVIDPAAGTVGYFLDLPVDYALAARLGGDDVITVTLEWGRQQQPDVFAIERFPRPDAAARSAFLHPILRRYRGGELVDEHHVLENLFGVWRHPREHVEPLRDWLASSLSDIRAGRAAVPSFADAAPGPA